MHATNIRLLALLVPGVIIHTTFFPCYLQFERWLLHFFLLLLTLRALSRIDATNITSKFPHWDSLCKKKQTTTTTTNNNKTNNTNDTIVSKANLFVDERRKEKQKKTCLCVNDRWDIMFHAHHTKHFVFVMYLLRTQFSTNFLSEVTILLHLRMCVTYLKPFSISVMCTTHTHTLYEMNVNASQPYIRVGRICEAFVRVSRCIYVFRLIVDRHTYWIKRAF